MKKRIIVGIVAVALVATVVGLKIRTQNNNKYLTVKTAVASKGDIKAYLSTTAVIKSKNTKNYYSPQGKVKKINIKVGDKVKKGQTLATFDVPDANTQKKQAEIAYNNAVLSKTILVNNNSDITNKIKDLNNQIDTMQKSTDPNVLKNIPALQQTRDSLKPISDEQFKQADNAIAAAKLSLDAANQNLAKSQDSIVSDIDGVVTALNIEEGAMASGSQPAVVVQDLDNLKAMVSVGKYDSNKIKIGEESVIKSGDKSYKGKVSFIEPVAKKVMGATGGDTTLGVDVDILDKADNLKIDFDADIDILLNDVKSVLKVPAESVKTDKTGKNYVYVVDGEKARERVVKLGVQSETEVEILEGIKAGEKVVLNPVATIKDGVLIKDGADK